MSGQPTPEEARGLLEQAERTASTTRAGSSWPQIAGLFGLGGASSLALPALAYVPDDLVLLPLILLFAWIGALFAFVAIFSRAVKRGFGRRWTATIVAWGILWVAGVFGIYWWFPGQVWFLAAISGAITVVTLVGAWLEARR
jgi:hypothetical protein